MSADNKRRRRVHLADRPEGPQAKVEEVGAQAVLSCTAFPPTGQLDSAGSPPDIKYLFRHDPRFNDDRLSRRVSTYLFG